jgi:hypothetical protein
LDGLGQRRHLRPVLVFRRRDVQGQEVPEGSTVTWVFDPFRRFAPS